MEPENAQLCAVCRDLISPNSVNATRSIIPKSLRQSSNACAICSIIWSVVEQTLFEIQSRFKQYDDASVESFETILSGQRISHNPTRPLSVLLKAEIRVPNSFFYSCHFTIAVLAPESE